jgi:hypothetical protein
MTQNLIHPPRETENADPQVDVDSIENPAETTPGVRQAGADANPVSIDPARRHHLIALAAYLRAERRRFMNGSPEDDWTQAEAEIDSRLRGNGP